MPYCLAEHATARQDRGTALPLQSFHKLESHWLPKCFKVCGGKALHKPCFADGRDAQPVLSRSGPWVFFWAWLPDCARQSVSQIVHLPYTFCQISIYVLAELSGSWKSQYVAKGCANSVRGRRDKGRNRNTCIPAETTLTHERHPLLQKNEGLNPALLFALPPGFWGATHCSKPRKFPGFRAYLCLLVKFRIILSFPCLPNQQIRADRHPEGAWWCQGQTASQGPIHSTRSSSC